MQRPKQTCARVPLLVAAHMLACTAPLLMPLVPLETTYLPLMWALAVPSVSAMMSLAAWIGLGRSRMVVRLVGGVGGIAYLALGMTAGNALPSRRAMSLDELLGNYLTAIGWHAAWGGSLAGAFLVARRWWRVERIDDIGAPPPPPKDWRQFSTLNILVLMGAAAVVLTFVQISRSAPDADPGSWQWAVVSAIAISIFFANTWFSVRAALDPPPLAPRLVGAVVVTIVLGIAIALSTGNNVHSAWVFACSCLILPLATLIVIGSTLVVRSCGYRLVPRTRGGKAPPETANTQACQDLTVAAVPGLPVEPSPP